MVTPRLFRSRRARTPQSRTESRSHAFLACLSLRWCLKVPAVSRGDGIIRVHAKVRPANNARKGIEQRARKVADGEARCRLTLAESESGTRGPPLLWAVSVAGVLSMFPIALASPSLCGIGCYLPGFIRYDALASPGRRRDYTETVPGTRPGRTAVRNRRRAGRPGVQRARRRRSRSGCGAASAR